MAAPSGAAPSGFDPKRRYEVATRDVTYRQDGDFALQLRLYQPRGDGPFPILIDVHGGAWANGARDNDRILNEALARSGLLVAAADFRLAPQHPYPAQIQDVNLAIRWLKAHAAELNATAECMGGFGSSSGAHTLMLCAMRARDPRYRSFPLPEAPELDASLSYAIDGWPILDPFARYFFAYNTGVARLVENTERYFLTYESVHEGNPQEALDRGEQVELPAVLIVHGTEDGNVPVTISERFAASYRAAGGEAQLEVFPGEPHGFANAPGRSTERAHDICRAFIARQLAASVASPALSS